jgi:hypothetical protein
MLGGTLQAVIGCWYVLLMVVTLCCASMHKAGADLSKG